MKLSLINACMASTGTPKQMDQDSASACLRFVTQSTLLLVSLSRLSGTETLVNVSASNKIAQELLIPMTQLELCQLSSISPNAHVYVVHKTARPQAWSTMTDNRLTLSGTLKLALASLNLKHALTWNTSTFLKENACADQRCAETTRFSIRK